MLSDGVGKNGRLPNRIDATKRLNRIALCSKPDFPFPANAAPLLSAIRFAGTETLLREMLGHDPDRCLLCEEGGLQPYQTRQPHPSRRRWVLTVA